MPSLPIATLTARLPPVAADREVLPEPARGVVRRGCGRSPSCGSARPSPGQRRGERLVVAVVHVVEHHAAARGHAPPAGARCPTTRCWSMSSWGCQRSSPRRIIRRTYALAPSPRCPRRAGSCSSRNRICLAGVLAHGRARPSSAGTAARRREAPADRDPAPDGFDQPDQQSPSSGLLSRPTPAAASITRRVVSRWCDQSHRAGRRLAAGGTERRGPGGVGQHAGQTHRRGRARRPAGRAGRRRRHAPRTGCRRRRTRRPGSRTPSPRPASSRTTRPRSATGAR